jgi:hypothetical protein
MFIFLLRVVTLRLDCQLFYGVSERENWSPTVSHLATAARPLIH